MAKRKKVAKRTSRPKSERGTQERAKPTTKGVRTPDPDTGRLPPRR